MSCIIDSQVFFVFWVYHYNVQGCVFFSICSRLINARKKALQAEKVRSARVAKLPLTIQPSQVCKYWVAAVAQRSSVLSPVCFAHKSSNIIGLVYLIRWNWDMCSLIFQSEHRDQEATCCEENWSERFRHNALSHVWGDSGKRDRVKWGEPSGYSVHPAQ